MKNLLIGAVLGAVITVYFLPARVIQSPLGNFTNETNEKVFLNTVTFEGEVESTGDANFETIVNIGTTALGTGATTTITAANVCDTSTITVAPATAAASTTLPTATALAADCLDAQYEYRDITFINTATTAASTTILKIADASTTLLFAQATGTSTATLSGGEALKLRFVRNAATTNWVFLTEFTSQ